jgi:hypothetical protein
VTCKVQVALDAHVGSEGKGEDNGERKVAKGGEEWRSDNAVQVAVLLVSNGRDGISADSRKVDRAVTFLVNLADEDAGERREGMISTWRDFSVGNNRDTGQ